jgi:putative ABC transport system permease protein
MTAFGWESPEEALKHAINRSTENVTGVVKNFHYRGLQSTVEPVAIFHMAEDYRYLTLTIDSRNIESIKEFIRTKHNELFPGILYEDFFLNEDFDRQYNSEERISKIIAAFTIIGIIIACLGLFGLAAFIAQQRVKEIGIRKVLGASILSVTIMLSVEFIKWVALANIIAWPAAWLIMDYWLQDFAYRTEINPLIFIIAGLTALIIAVITVSFQAIKASLANPVESLRYE